MPKLNKKQVTVVGMKRVKSGTEFTLSNGKVVITPTLETIGWDKKLKEAPVIVINRVQYKNEVPQPQRVAWHKAEIKHRNSV